MVISFSIVWFVKHSNLFTFFKYSTLELFILFRSNDIAAEKYSRPLCKTHSNFMTTEWKVLSLLPCNYLTFPTVNSHLDTSNVMIWETYSSNSCTNSVIYSLILISILLFFRYLIFIHKKVWALPFVTVNPGNLYFALRMKSSITSCFTCETLLSSTYQAMVQYFLFMSLLSTHVISI